MSNDIWTKWLEDNYKYIAMAMQSTEKDRQMVLKLANICEKRGVSLRTFLEIVNEVNKEDTNVKN